MYAFLCFSVTLILGVPAGDSPFTGQWNGIIEVPTQDLNFILHLGDENGKLAGTIDIPQQGAVGLPLTGLQIEGEQITFEIENVPGKPTFHGRLQDGAIAGDFSQSGMTLPFTMKRPGEPLIPAPEPEVPALGSELQGHWEGAIKAPNQDLGIKVDVTAAGATIDIPQQGITSRPLANLAQTGPNFHFEIPGIPGKPTFDGTLAEGRIEGRFTQSGMEMTFFLARDHHLPVMNRPQEPKPPFPYAQQELTWPNGDITLTGTLTLPQGEGPFPAAVLITGSGPQNRDEELLGHKPFLVIADHLTRHGFAVLRYDDRGVGGSTGSVMLASSADFAGDVIAAVAMLRGNPMIDAGKVGVIGHSEGGLVGPLAAAQSGDIAFVVMLAGPGVTGEEVVVHQTGLIQRAAGTSESEVALNQALMREVFAMLHEGLDQEAIKTSLKQTVAERKAQDPDLDPAELARVEANLTTGLSSLTTPWFHFFRRLNRTRTR